MLIIPGALGMPGASVPPLVTMVADDQAGAAEGSVAADRHVRGEPVG
jgi:hypothetical protein